MNAYTVSRLAFDAGVSVHIVRDYLLRGLLRLAVRRRQIETNHAFATSPHVGIKFG